MPNADVKPQYAIAIAIAHVDDAAGRALMYLVDERHLCEVIIAPILSLLPDPRTYRLTITGDIVKSVHGIEERDHDTPTRPTGALATSAHEQSRRTMALVTS